MCETQCQEEKFHCRLFLLQKVISLNTRAIAIYVGVDQIEVPKTRNEGFYKTAQNKRLYTGLWYFIWLYAPMVCVVTCFKLRITYKLFEYNIIIYSAGEQASVSEIVL